MAVNQAARVPTDAELAQINQYVPSGYAKLTADEVAIVSVMVTNNLLTYNYQKWSIASLNVMPSLITGKQSTVNHDSWNVEKVLGKIFNATYTKSRNVPAAKLNSVNAYQADLNKEIVAKETNKYSRGSYEKAKQILNWEPNTDIKSLIKKVVEEISL